MIIVNNREEEVLRNVIEVVKKRLNPCRIILFGSRAKPDTVGNSDFDLAVDAEKGSIQEEREVKEEVDKVSGLYKIDIVYLHSVEESFRTIILKTGKVAYERSS